MLGRGWVTDGHVTFPGTGTERDRRRALLAHLVVVEAVDRRRQFLFRDPGEVRESFGRDTGAARDDDRERNVGHCGTVERGTYISLRCAGGLGDVGDDTHSGATACHISECALHNERRGSIVRRVISPGVDLDVPITPAINATPQAPGPRRASRLWTRDRLDLYRPEHAATARAAVLTVAASPSPLALEAALIPHLGWNYCFDHRCDGTTHCHDCSGYQCWGMGQIGRSIGCTSSFVIAQMCWDAGLYIADPAEAATIPHWAFHGANQGRTSNGAPNGSDGHIVYANITTTGPWSTVPGHVPGTLEAMGHAYGVRRGNYAGRGWTGLYRILGLNYDLVVPTPARSAWERDMILQTHHFDPKTGHPRALVSTVKGQYGYVIIAANGQSVECWYGASLANDQPDPHNPHLRLWTPKYLAPGHKIVGLEERFPGTVGQHHPDNVPQHPDFDQHPGVLAVDDTGLGHRGHWS